MRPTVRDLATISRVDSAAWNQLDHARSPFLEHGFLSALEKSDSVGAAAGWEPHYLVAEVPASESNRRCRLVGAVTAFIKTHSYGEYIFDWSWAHASEQLGAAYYPKLVVACPATPATGSRLLLARDLDAAQRETVAAVLIEAVRELADATLCSSIHWLFTTESEQRLLERHGFWPRASFQFHWHNHAYPDFEGFLTSLTSRKRKQIRKERRRALAQVDSISIVNGCEFAAEHLHAIERFYRTTTAAYGGYRYLRPGFFTELWKQAPERLLLAEARVDGHICAGALFLETDQALYGRYWGCADDREFLHFELAYYAGIEHAITRGLPLFEAGAQGEHKLLRGFVPSPTYSAHWIRHPVLGRAVQQFLLQEASAVRERMRELGEYTPFRCSSDASAE